MFASILMLLGLAVLAPWIQRRWGRHAGLPLALVPAGIAVRVALGLHEPRWAEWFPWAEDLGLQLAFSMDGWSGLFALMISGIGALVVLYGSHYLEHDPAAGRFQSALLVFMASMLGVVWSDSFILLFIFWELTSVTSYLLIGHDHAREVARKAALQAMLLTGGGGLALLAGLVLLGQETGHWTLSGLLAHPLPALDSPITGAALLLILLGCFTKSAQVPFHAWLPNAMEAPTPASAYLHSSTMVKAGVFLLGRLLPVLGPHPWWGPALQVAGWSTFLFGAWMVLRSTQAKRVLAYTTLSALGLMVLLLGTGTSWAVKAVAVLLPAHALYKGALFLLAGALDHETGEKDLARMGGLRRELPVLLAGGMLAALSMAGVIPFLGFLAKETLLEGWVAEPWYVVAAGLGALALLGSAGLAVGLGPFLGARLPTSRCPHGPSFGLWVPSMLLGLASLLLGLAPGLCSGPLAAAAKALAPGMLPWSIGLWHGMTPAFILGLVTLAAAVALWRWRPSMLAWAGRLPTPAHLGPDALYHRLLKILIQVARIQTQVLQTGLLSQYVRVILFVVLGLAGGALLLGTIPWPAAPWRDLHWFECGLSGVIVGSTLWCVQARSRLGVVVALGLVGYSVALLFLILGAPDLAMTQFVVETLTVLLFVLTLRKLPPFFRLTRVSGRLRDALLAGAVGLLMAALTLLVAGGPRDTHLKDYFLGNSLPLAHGRNVVNVILVDFRGLDTLGEITVLAVVAIGAFALLRLRLTPDREQP